MEENEQIHVEVQSGLDLMEENEQVAVGNEQMEVESGGV